MKIQDKSWLMSLAKGDSVILCDTRRDPVEIGTVPITRVSKVEVVILDPYRQKVRFSRLTGLGIGNWHARDHLFIAPLSVQRLAILDEQWHRYQLLNKIRAVSVSGYTIERLEAILEFIS